MTRKRFRKLLMTKGFSARQANLLANWYLYAFTLDRSWWTKEGVVCHSYQGNYDELAKDIRDEDWCDINSDDWTHDETLQSMIREMDRWSKLKYLKRPIHR